jgi:hypothetical protein
MYTGNGTGETYMCIQCAANIHTACTVIPYTADVQRVTSLKKTLKGHNMKKVVAASILALGLGFGFAQADNKAAVELEHANKTATGIDSVDADMSKMKAAGKCNAGQSGKMKPKMKKSTRKPTKAELELEHANKLSTGDDSVQGDMKNMKAQGKCNTGK